jgi:hypothetical protein
MKKTRISGTWIWSCLLLGSLVGCSGEKKDETVNTTSTLPHQTSLQYSSTSQSLKSEGTPVIDEVLLRKELNDISNLKQRIEVIKSWGRTRKKVAAPLIIDEIKMFEAKLPEQLDIKAKNFNEIEFDLSYLSTALGKLRLLNTPEGNREADDFVKRFRNKYGSTQIGSDVIKVFETEIKNAAEDAKLPPPNPTEAVQKWGIE